jgi:hypothetical protein
MMSQNGPGPTGQSVAYFTVNANGSRIFIFIESAGSLLPQLWNSETATQLVWNAGPASGLEVRLYPNFTSDGRHLALFDGSHICVFEITSTIPALKKRIKISSSDQKFVKACQKPQRSMYPIQAFAVSSDTNRVALVSLYNLDRVEDTEFDEPNCVKAGNTEHQLCYTARGNHLFYVFRKAGKLEIVSYDLTSKVNRHGYISEKGRTKIKLDGFAASCSTCPYNVQYDHQACILLEVTFSKRQRLFTTGSSIEQRKYYLVSADPTKPAVIAGGGDEQVVVIRQRALVVTSKPARLLVDGVTKSSGKGQIEIPNISNGRLISLHWKTDDTAMVSLMTQSAEGVKIETMSCNIQQPEAWRKTGSNQKRVQTKSSIGSSLARTEDALRSREQRPVSL